MVRGLILLNIEQALRAAFRSFKRALGDPGLGSGTVRTTLWAIVLIATWFLGSSTIFAAFAAAGSFFGLDLIGEAPLSVDSSLSMVLLVAAANMTATALALSIGLLLAHPRLPQRSRRVTLVIILLIAIAPIPLIILTGRSLPTERWIINSGFVLGTTLVSAVAYFRNTWRLDMRFLSYAVAGIIAVVLVWVLPQEWGYWRIAVPGVLFFLGMLLPYAMVIAFWIIIYFALPETLWLQLRIGIALVGGSFAATAYGFFIAWTLALRDSHLVRERQSL